MSGLDPLERWRHRGIECAIASSPFGTINGYVRLPKTIATLSGARRVGYQLPFRVHGGITYGPDQEGWIGFDTLHAGDIWPLEIIEEHKSERRKGMDYDPCFASRQHPPDWAMHWTVEGVREETERLARQVWSPLIWIRCLAIAVGDRLQSAGRGY